MSCCGQKRAELKGSGMAAGSGPLPIRRPGPPRTPPGTEGGRATPVADRDSAALVAYLMRNARLRPR